MPVADLIRTLDLRGRKLSKRQYFELLPRAEMDIPSALREVESIIEQVRNGTDVDLLNLAERFDGVRPAQLRVPQDVIAKMTATQRAALPKG